LDLSPPGRITEEVCQAFRAYPCEMGLFGSGPRDDASTDESLDALVQRARSGDTQGALAAGNVKLARVEKRSGAGSPAYATALFEHASLCLVLGMVERAVASMRAAAEIRGETRDDEKNRLTYLMNLGDSLAYAGRLEEALAVHERGLRDRERFYGKEHAGYAYGLDSWADVALALGRYKEALESAQRAIEIYGGGHERVPNAWSTFMLAAGGMKATWKELRLDPELACAVLDALTNRHLPVAAFAAFAAVEVVVAHAKDPQRMLAAWAAVQRRAMVAGDHATGAGALERIRALAQASGDHGLVLQAERGLGLVHDRAGDHAAAARDYERAISLARTKGSAEEMCATLRNAGLYFVERDPDRGLALLREAADTMAEPSEERARSRIALGIQLQHRGALVDARARLASALAEIDAAHPDAMCGRSHLRAIDEKQSCGCGDTKEEIHAQVERIVRDRLPAGLLDRIAFDGENVGIHVTRALTEDEARLVADTVDLAMSEMRARIRATYG
jgi:tetratricopeptide (TPR) repeat protein